MEANLLFSDFTVPINAGVAPGSVATGTTSGNAIQLGGPGPIGKLLFRALCTGGSASANVKMVIYSATASNGTFASIPSASQSMLVAASSTSNILNVLQIDTRNEAFADLANNIAWVQPVLVITGTATLTFLDCIGWESGIQPARRLESLAPLSTTVARTELDVYSSAGYSSPN